MHSKQDGQEIPPYAAETAREIGHLGPGGDGNKANMGDALLRGITPELAAAAAERARAAQQIQREKASQPEARPLERQGPARKAVPGKKAGKALH